MSLGLLDPVIAKCRETFDGSVEWRLEVAADPGRKPTVELKAVQRRMMGRSGGVRWAQAELASIDTSIRDRQIEELAQKLGALARR